MPNSPSRAVTEIRYTPRGPSKSGPVLWEFTRINSLILRWDFLWKSHKSAVLSAHACNFLQAVQHFCHSRQQKCCAVCTLRQFSADSTTLSGSSLQAVHHSCCPEWQKCCTVCRKWHACADSKALSAQNPPNHILIIFSLYSHYILDIFLLYFEGVVLRP